MSDLLKLAAARRPGFSLPAPFYTSPAVFDADMDLIFARHWIFVGSEPEIAEAGDYLTVDLGRHSVVVLRDDDGGIRAFHNVCRHRGARLIGDKKGFVGNLVCPYHQWTYDLTGALIHTEPMGADFDAACFGLKTVHIKRVAGLIFLCLAASPPTDFDDFATTALPYLAPHGLADCKVAHQSDLIEDGNWKLTIENNRECHHCGGHPELLHALFHFFGYAEAAISPQQRGYYERFQKTSADFSEIWDRLGLPWRTIEDLSGRPSGYRLERLALDGAGESYTMDTKAACQKLLGGFVSPRIGSLSLHTQPNAWHHFLGDQVVTFAVFPLSADRTLVRTTWLVHRDAIEGVDYDIDRLTHVWRRTNEQDATFVGYAQAGAQNPAYEPGPYAPSEYMVDAFCDWYLERLRAGSAA